MNKVKSYNEIAHHPIVTYVDATDWDSSLPTYDRNPILIGLCEGWICPYNQCGMISATSKRDAINKLNEVINQAKQKDNA